MDDLARNGRIGHLTDQVEGLVQANWVEVRVLFGALRRSRLRGVFFVPRTLPEPGGGTFARKSLRQVALGERVALPRRTSHDRLDRRWTGDRFAGEVRSVTERSRGALSTRAEARASWDSIGAA
jgi:hypothetical protein